MNPAKESEITMASVEKFSAGAVRNQLRHNRREIEHSGNPDIDPSRQGQDYVLSPDRGMIDYDYFLQRKSELYCYNRDDVKVMAGWVVTAPQDLDPERYDNFSAQHTIFGKSLWRGMSCRPSSMMTREPTAFAFLFRACCRRPEARAGL